MSASMNAELGSAVTPGPQHFSVVIPTIGRPGVATLLTDLDHGAGPRPDEVIVVDDRRAGGALDLPSPGSFPLRVLRSGGRGPAAARNTGWLAARSEWVAFLDDDVVIPHDWAEQLVRDLGDCGPSDAGSTARIAVPAPPGRPSDSQRNTMGLQGARWITADLAYRRSALSEVGGFDETFPRAYREDSDLALRILEAGHRIVSGHRITQHPTPDPGTDSWLASVRRQRGNADDATMLARHGRDWRARAGAGHGRLWLHAATTGAALAAAGLALGRRPRSALAAGVSWAVLTGRFAAQRIGPGPRTPVEIGRMLASSILIPPVACYHRFRGETAARFGATRQPSLVWSTPSAPAPLRNVPPAGGSTAAADHPRPPGGGTPVLPPQDLP